MSYSNFYFHKPMFLKMYFNIRILEKNWQNAKTNPKILQSASFSKVYSTPQKVRILAKSMTQKKRKKPCSGLHI